MYKNNINNPNNIKNRKRNSTGFFSLLKITLLFYLIAGLTLLSGAQETWNLTKCIDYALENNIDLNVKYNDVKTQQYNLSESKASLLPNLNMGSSMGLNFGRNIDGNTNEITYNQTLGNNYWISSSMDIFNGLVNYNTIRYNKFLLSAKKEEAMFDKNKLIFKIINLYFTVLYSKGLVKVAQSQLVLSGMQLERMQKLVKVGKESPVTVQELKSLQACDKLNLILAENNMSKILLELKQLLRVSANRAIVADTSDGNIDVVSSELIADSIYNRAVHILPEIKHQEFLYKASVKELSVARGSALPSLYLSAGFYTNYYNGDERKYSSQIKNNQNQSINLGITIPIFNRKSVYSNIRRKKIALINQEFELDKQKEVLYSEIMKVIDELRYAEKEYQSSVELKELSELTLKDVSKKIENGLANITDYEAAKQRFMLAEAELLKAKIIYLIRKQMAEFYRTANWNHLYS